MADKGKAGRERAVEARRVVGAARRKERRRAFAIWTAVIVVGLVLVGFAAKVIVDAAQHDREVAQAAAGEIDGVTSTSDLSANHVEALPEPTATGGVRVPPVGGDHDAIPQNCGIYSTPVGTWNAVHSLEHGAVWVTYEPGLAADQIAVLASDAKGHDHVLLSPYPQQPSPVILTAWGLQLRVDSASDPRVEAFIKKYESGPQTPEPGAPCSGGMGEPHA